MYESSDRIGGSIKTVRRDGYLAEMGPGSLAAPSDVTATLITDLGLDPSRLTAAPDARHRYIVRRGRLIATSDVAR